MQIFQKVGYTQDEVNQMIKVDNVRFQRDSIVEELTALFDDNEDYFSKFSGPEALDARVVELGIHITKDEQKAMSEEVIGVAWCLEDFGKRLPN